MEQETPEEWRPVVEWEGWYSVSVLGRVRRDRGGTRTYPGRVLKSWIDRKGYVAVGLTRGTHESLRFRMVHQLVARAFIGPPPDGIRGINHINGVKTDNRPSNLEWATPAANSRHAVMTGLMPSGDRSSRRLYPDSYPRGDAHHARQHPEMLKRGESHANSKLTDEAARDILTSPLKQAELASKYGVSQTLISAVRRRLVWQHIMI